MKPRGRQAAGLFLFVGYDFRRFFLVVFFFGAFFLAVFFEVFRLVVSFFFAASRLRSRSSKSIFTSGSPIARAISR